MKINNDIYRRAKNVVANKVHLQTYIDMCIEARICPECGEDGLKLYVNGDTFDCECRHCDWNYTALT